MQLPTIWLVVSGLFFAVNTVVFIVLAMLLVKLMKVVDDLKPKVESLTDKVDTLTVKVSDVATQVEEVARSVRQTVDVVGSKTRSIASTADRFTTGASTSLERFAPFISGAFTLLKLFKTMQASRETKKGR